MRAQVARSVSQKDLDATEMWKTTFMSGLQPAYGRRFPI